MRRIIISALLATGVLGLFATQANAGGLDFSIVFGVPAPVVVATPPVVYPPPPVVYAPPPVVYAPPPVVYASRPPLVYAPPPPVVYEPPTPVFAYPYGQYVIRRHHHYRHVWAPYPHYRYYPH